MDNNPQNTHLGEQESTHGTAPFSNYQSPLSFGLLCLLSFNVYLFFWFYKHWTYLKEHKNSRIHPGFRVLLIAVTGFGLFIQFKRLALENGYAKKLPVSLLFALFLAVFIFGYASGSLLLGLLSLFSFLILLPLLHLLNFYYLAQHPHDKVTNRMSRDEKLFLLVFWVLLLLWGLGII